MGHKEIKQDQTLNTHCLQSYQIMHVTTPHSTIEIES